MRLSIESVLELTARYAALAREQGLTGEAERLSRVPAQGARNLPEALQSLRILHYAMWCEGDYHNTLGRFDQYMFPYLKADLAAGRESEESAFELLEAFFLSCNRDSDLYPGMQQGDNGQSTVLAGMRKDGTDGWNERSVAANAKALASLSEQSGVPVYLLAVPSAARGCSTNTGPAVRSAAALATSSS